MTYHPIDKPTEPGHYWYLGMHDTEYEIKTVYWYDGILKVDTCMTVMQCSGQFFGPAIEPPQKRETKKDLLTPRPFRWRDEIGATGYGVFHQTKSGWRYSVCDDPTTHYTSLKSCRNDGYSITEWLDEPATDGQTQGTVR